MCDYSLESVRSRPAKVGDKLTTCDFGTCTRGFAAAEDAKVAVCVLPGTELAFSSTVKVVNFGYLVRQQVETLSHATAIFRQVNKDEPRKHHDALEFPDGHIVLLTQLCEGQGGNGASAACAADNHGRSRCSETHRQHRLSSEHIKKGMSALPPKADMCSATRHVRFVPQADN